MVPLEAVSEQSWGRRKGLHRGAKAKGCEMALCPGQRWVLISRLRGYYPGVQVTVSPQAS